MQNKIDKVAFFLPSFNIGGVERVFINLANHLLSSYSVYFVVCTNNGELISSIDVRVRIINLGNIKLRNSVFPLVKVLRKEKFDYVISGGDYPNMILIVSSLFVRGIVCVISQHNYYNKESKTLGIFSLFTEFFMRLLYPYANRTIAVSSGIKEYLNETIRLPLDKIFLLYNAIDIDKVRKDSLSYKTENYGDYIVYVGRLSKVKNLPMMVDAFSRCDNKGLKLLVIGDGSEREELESIAKRTNKSGDIIFVGQVDNPMPYIRNSKALVSTSLSESFGMVFLEALALNVPVLSTPTKGALEVLNSCKMAIISEDFNRPDLFADLIDRIVDYSHDDCSSFLQKYDINTAVKKLSVFLRHL